MLVVIILLEAIEYILALKIVLEQIPLIDLKSVDLLLAVVFRLVDSMRMPTIVNNRRPFILWRG